MARPYVPSRGHIVFTNFDPALGREQAMKRPALVLSPTSFNRKVGLVLAAPITSRVRGHGFEVALVGTRTHGVVLCQQVKTMDYKARGMRFVEDAPDTVVQDALARVRAIIA